MDRRQNLLIGIVVGIVIVGGVDLRYGFHKAIAESLSACIADI